MSVVRAVVVSALILNAGIASAAQLTATWTDNTGGVASTQIDRKRQTDASFTTLTSIGPGIATYVDATVSEGVTYCYRVKAFNEFGESPFSETVCATPTPSTYTVTVAKAGAGTGTVASNPAGISCGSDCNELYTAGAVVTLAATAASGSRFDGWSGGGCSGTSSCTISGNATATVTATFSVVAAPPPPAPTTYTLTVTKAGAGAGTVASSPAGISCGSDCSEPYAAGAVVTLAATPASGSRFEGWSGGCSGTGACTVPGTATATVTATFSVVAAPPPPPTTYTLTVAKAGAGAGTVASSPAGISCGSDCNEPYAAGAVVTLAATPASGSRFDGWSGGGCSGTGSCTIPGTATATVTATFSVVAAPAPTPTPTPVVTTPTPTTTTTTTSTSDPTPVTTTTSTTSTPQSLMSTVQSYVSTLAPYRVMAQLKEYIEPLFTPAATAAPPPPPAPAASAPVLEPVPVPEPSPAMTAMVIAPQAAARPIPQPRWTPPSPADGRTTHRLVARFTGKTWIKVRMDNGQVNRETVKRGAVRQWVSNGRFLVSVGNAGAVSFELNGRPVPALGESGATVSDVVLPPEQ